METDQCIDGEPNPKRPKIETDTSTSSKPSGASDDSAILSLPTDILAKIIAYVPIAQWPSFDLLSEFQPATAIAWRQLRNINLESDFLIKPDQSSLGKSIEYLVARSPLLTSLSGIDLRMTPDSDIVNSLAKFEHLQSITLGDAKLFNNGRRGIRLGTVVDFLRSTRSRTSLKELQLFDIVHREDRISEFQIPEHYWICKCARDANIDRFASALINAREFGCYEWVDIRLPLKLEKFVFTSADQSLFLRLDTLDTTRLTDVRLGMANAARVEPAQLISLIERATNLRRIEFSFLTCVNSACGGRRLETNKKLLAALAAHENLSTIKFGNANNDSYCACLNFGHDFVRMLESIGRRGRLRKLSLSSLFNLNETELDQVSTAINEHIPYLQSIEICIYIFDDDEGSTLKISNMTKLEEIRLSLSDISLDLTANVISEISKLPHMKRLSLDTSFDDHKMHWPEVGENDHNSLQLLANASRLVDLRIPYVYSINADVFEKWSEGFGSNLQCLMLSEIGSSDHEDEDYDENGLVRLLKKACRLRVVILEGYITDRSMMAIAQSCPELKILGVESNEITVRGLQEIIDRCPKLERLGGVGDEIRSHLKFPKYRKIGDVDIMQFSQYNFDDGYYE